MPYMGLLHKYGHLLDLPPHTRAVSLLEGNTPLIRADNLSHQLGGGFELFVKYEGLNPTGSFKDRGMTAAISEAAGRGVQAVICASTGNTAASAAAYAARTRMRAMVLEITQRSPIALVNSLNPYRLEGQKTAAFEICDALGSAPDLFCLPVGNAGNITSYWMGFCQYNALKRTGLPR